MPGRVSVGPLQRLDQYGEEADAIERVGATVPGIAVSAAIRRR
jgi:hypothetical protein